MQVSVALFYTNEAAGAHADAQIDDPAIQPYNAAKGIGIPEEQK
jgi:hypothetical protein